VECGVIRGQDKPVSHQMLSNGILLAVIHMLVLFSQVTLGTVDRYSGCTKPMPGVGCGCQCGAGSGVGHGLTVQGGGRVATRKDATCVDGDAHTPSAHARPCGCCVDT
jgi:hypothetical protein